MRKSLWPLIFQPPSGGCVLKLCRLPVGISRLFQPPSGGCVLKPKQVEIMDKYDIQPPSGGCVLKPSTFSYRQNAFSSRLRAAVC